MYMFILTETKIICWSSQKWLTGKYYLLSPHGFITNYVMACQAQGEHCKDELFYICRTFFMTILLEDVFAESNAYYFYLFIYFFAKEKCFVMKGSLYTTWIHDTLYTSYLGLRTLKNMSLLKVFCLLLASLCVYFNRLASIKVENFNLWFIY
jgi:hypothetical protein